jgi:hypothetical protein
MVTGTGFQTNSNYKAHPVPYEEAKKEKCGGGSLSAMFVVN